MNPRNKTFQRSVLGLLFAALALLSATGTLERIAGTLGANRLASSNREYIDKSFDASMKGFLMLSAIKSGLAVIEGSEVGIGFSVEVGDVVQSVYDYVDVAWKTALVGGTVLVLTKLLLQAVGLINHLCLALVFLLLLAILLQRMFFPRIQPSSAFLTQLFSAVTVLTLALYIILPLSISGAAWMSGKITNPLMDEAREGFSSVKDDLSADNLSEKLFRDNPREEESWIDRLNLPAQYEKTKMQLKAMGNYLAGKAEEIAVWTIKLIAGYLFDCLVFPITFFVLLYVFTRFSFQYLINLSLAGTKESSGGLS